jgi:predicted CxxxxCH...CXXCH cytochrome family protein
VFRLSIDRGAVRHAVALLFGVACGTSPPAPPTHGLAMPDVSILAPLPASLDAPVITAITGEPIPLVGTDIYTRLVSGPADIAPKLGLPLNYGDFQVVAIRFELCVRDLPRPCELDEDGRLRLVLQPMYTANGQILAHDVALHAFYPIPNAELGDAVEKLRALAAVQDVPPDAPLEVSPALAAGDTTYRDQLRDLVSTYALQEKLVRLTVMGQAAASEAFEWIMRGVAYGDAGWADIQIPELTKQTKQVAQLGGGDAIYNVDPGIDSPPGFVFAINGALFDGGTTDDQMYALDALATIQNPAWRGAGNTQCVGCHISTFLTTRRAAYANVDPASLTMTYRTPYNTSVSSIANMDPRVVRAFGWAASAPAISQRVANDTAQLLAEIEKRFPIP